MSSKKLPNKNLLMILIPVTLLLVSIFVSLFLLINKDNYDRWFSPSWPYRKAIYVEIPADRQGTDLGILLQVNTKELIEEGKLKQDCEDLRIIDAYSRKQLNLDIEGQCNKEESNLWVNLPSSKERKRILYMYYGNDDVQELEKGLEIEKTSQEGINIAFGGEEVAEVLGTTGSGPSQPSGPEVEGSTNPSDINTSIPGFSTIFEHPDYP